MPSAVSAARSKSLGIGSPGSSVATLIKAAPARRAPAWRATQRPGRRCLWEARAPGLEGSDEGFGGGCVAGLDRVETLVSWVLGDLDDAGGQARHQGLGLGWAGRDPDPVGRTQHLRGQPQERSAQGAGLAHRIGRAANRTVPGLVAVGQLKGESAAAATEPDEPDEPDEPGRRTGTRVDEQAAGAVGTGATRAWTGVLAPFRKHPDAQLCPGAGACGVGPRGRRGLASKLLSAHGRAWLAPSRCRTGSARSGHRGNAAGGGGLAAAEEASQR